MEIKELPVPEQVKEVLIKSGIVKLYPPQEEAIKAGALEGKNLVLASPTASGKTLVAELCTLKHVLERDGKVIYLTPLRALANEKFEEFKKYASLRKNDGRRIRVGISTGDFDSGDPWLERYDIIITSVDYEEPIIIRKNGTTNIERIGKFIDDLMRKNRDKVQTNAGTEVLDVSDLDLKAVAFEPKNLKLAFRKVSSVIRHKTDSLLCRLKLETGREITVTPNHSIYTLEGLDIITKKASDIKPGDFVLIPRRLPLDASEKGEIDLIRELSKLKEAENLFIKNIPSEFFTSSVFNAIKVRNHYKKNWRRRRELPLVIFTRLRFQGELDLSRVYFSYLGSRHKVPADIPINSELLRLIGYYIAEGSMNEKNYRVSFSFASKEKEYIEDACKIVQKIFHFKPSVSDRKNVTYIDIRNKIVYLLFNKILKLPKRAKNKRVPSLVFNIRHELQREFLKSLVAGDGTFGKRLDYATSSRSLASDLLYLLLQDNVVGTFSSVGRKSMLPSGKSILDERFDMYVNAWLELRHKSSHRTCMIPTSCIKEILKTLSRKSSNGSLARFGKRTSKMMFEKWLASNEIKTKMELLELLKGKKLTGSQLSKTLELPCSTINERLKFLYKRGLIERQGHSGSYTYVISRKGLCLLDKIESAKKLFNSDLAFATVKEIERVPASKGYVYDVSIPECENFVAGIGGVICHNTNEKADSLLRHRAKWMDEVSLIVADEVHLLNDAERGPTLEVVLARFMQINPDVQILALSATINNVEEIAAWLKAGYITTEWRPILLKEGVLLHDEIQFKDGDAHKIERKTGNPAINLALSTVKAGGQALIFASTRKNAVMLAKKVAGEIEEILSRPVKRSLEHESERIMAAGEKTRISETLAELVKRGTAFHHAGLGGEHRKIIEDTFREGKIKVLTATPTLAFGVNLPARTVVIHDYRRYEPGYGYYPISVLEYKQMAGRAGRPKYDKVGEAILIAKTDEEADYLMESYIMASPERIWSRLAVERILRSHVLATIAADFARTERGIYDFFSRTFYAYQYEISAIKSIIAKILKYLYDEEMIDVAGENIYATKFGKRVSELYIDPVSAVIIRNALRRKPQCLTEFSLLHLISHTPDMGPILRPYSRELGEITIFMEEHKEELLVDVPDEWEDRIAYEQFLGEVKTAMVLGAWIEEKSEDEIIEKFRTQPGDLYRTIENAKWLLYATHELGVLFGNKEMLPLTLELMERVEKGVKKELLPIVRLEGVGRARGRILYNAGYKTIEDIKMASVEDLMNLPLIGPRLAKKIKEQVGGFVKKETWEKLEKGDLWKQKALTEY
ncbi:MAG: DEAD/DEAH box helicase [Candidatus Bathyarchaeia archaeon]